MRNQIFLQYVSHIPEGRGMKIGYARVSTREQTLEIQLTKLAEASCEMFFDEKISGAARRRPRLEAMQTAAQV